MWLIYAEQDVESIPNGFRHLRPLTNTLLPLVTQRFNGRSGRGLVGDQLSRTADPLSHRPQSLWHRVLQQRVGTRRATFQIHRRKAALEVSLPGSRHSSLSAGGRVEMWRGSSRFGLSVSAPFVWRCLSNLAVTPFPHPPHRTGHADFPHPALGQNLTPSPTTCHARSD